MNTPDFIPDYIRNITSLDLTPAGMVDLICYPEDAIKRADSALRRATKERGPLDVPFKYFAKVAYNYCKDNNIKPDWGYRKEKAGMLGIKDSDPRTKQSTPNTVSEEHLTKDPSYAKASEDRPFPNKMPPQDFGQSNLPF